MRNPGAISCGGANSGVFVFGHLLPMNEQNSLPKRCFVRP